VNRFLPIALCLAAGTLASCTTQRPHVQPSLGAKTWTSTDGKQMPWRVWNVPRGTTERCVLITVHGLSGTAEDFHALGEALPSQGIAVYGYELRGQGNDPDRARRGDIDEPETWLRDLMTFHRLVRARHPGVPVVWYGESLGSLIALHAAASHCPCATPDAVIFASPIGGLRTQVGGLRRALLRSASRVLPTLRVKLGGAAGVDENKVRVTSTTTHGGQMAKTPHHVPAFTLRLLRGLDDLLRANERAAGELRLPVLMLGSPNDVVSSEDQVRVLFGWIASDDKRLLWYRRSYHLLLHDVQHEEVVRDVAQWMSRHGWGVGQP